MRFLCAAALFCAALRAETALVLPFFNHSSSPNLDWIGESISESVHDSLESEGVLALDRSDRLEAYRRLSLRPGAELTHASIMKIGEALDASSVVYGSYELGPSEPGRELKATLHITGRIIDLKHSRQGAVLEVSGALEDLAALEARLSWQAVSSLKPKTAPSEQDFLKARPPIRIDAVENYVRGLLAASPEQRFKLFTQAARLDASYSQPCFQLGKSYWDRKDYKTAASWFARVSRSDPRYMEAQFFLGLSSFYTGDFAAAEQSFQLVSAAVPLNEVFNNLGAAQSRRNNTASAAASFQKALEGDTADPDYHFNLGCTQWRTGQYDAAVTSFRAALDRIPNDPEATGMLGRALKHDPPRPGETHERLKTNYDEAAYRQLQAELSK
jgi:tetratricopeptide (TPR) repeat protein